MSPRRKRQSPGRATLALAASRDRTSLFHLLILSAATFALYASTLRSDFVLDDDYEVLKDQLIRSFANIPTLFAHGVWFFAGAKTENFYRPLKLLAYSVEYHLFGFRPAYWHLANILLHLAVVFAVYFLVRDLASASGTGTPAGAGAAAPNPASRLAFWSALFFAFHPIHVEAVAWIAAGNDLLCELALLLALWFYHRALYRTVQGPARLPRPEDSSGHVRRVAGARRGGKPAPTALLLYAGSVALFFAGLLFKETALTFPAIILSYDFFYRGESVREMLWGWPRSKPDQHSLEAQATPPNSRQSLERGWRRYLAYFAVLGLYLVLRIHALRGFAPASNRSLHLTLKDLVLSVPVLAVKYLWKLLLPINQNWWYVWQPVRALSWKPIAAIAVVLALVLAMFWLRPVPFGTGLRSPDSSGRGPDVERVQGAFKSGRRREPVLSLALAWFWLTLLPALDIFQVSANIVTDRYLYIPSFGFCVFAAWAWLWLRDRVASPLARRVAYACLLALLAFYTAIIFRRAPDWHDDLSLLTKTAQQSPGAGVIQAMLGKVYIDQRSYPEAFGHLQRAVTLDPTNAFAHNDLGSILLILGHPDQAAAETQKAVELDPTLYPFWSNLCLIYTHQKEWARAAEVCEHAAQLIDLEFDARKLDTRINLAIALVHLGRLDPAADQLVTGLRAEPGSPDAYLGHYELGVIYEDKGLWQEAAQQFQQALAQNPGYAPARTQLEAARAHLANP